MPTTVILALAAYLVGSVLFAVIASRVFQLPDPRAYGSGNPGTANVLRSGNKVATALTLAGDTLKGWLAVWLAQQFAPADAMEWEMAIAGAFVVIGHMYPVFHGLRGGKGVAPALGVLFGFSVYLGLSAIATWLVVAVSFRMSSFASIVAALFAPFAAWMIYGFAHPFFVCVVAVALLLIYRHRENIRNILAGTERKLKPASRSGA